MLDRAQVQCRVALETRAARQGMDRAATAVESRSSPEQVGGLRHGNVQYCGCWESAWSSESVTVVLRL